MSTAIIAKCIRLFCLFDACLSNTCPCVAAYSRFFGYYRYFYFLSLLKYNFRDKYNRGCTSYAWLLNVTFRQVMNYGRSFKRRLDYIVPGFTACAHCHRPSQAPIRSNRRFVIFDYISG